LAGLIGEPQIAQLADVTGHRRHRRNQLIHPGGGRCHNAGTSRSPD
jgi:hypothetical protein